ncbi:MAG: hypothetical protein ACK4IX_03840, partial [Candidatus Sericytochromatia bacterium]
YISRRGYIDHHSFEIMFVSLTSLSICNYLENKSNKNLFYTVLSITLLFITWGGSTLYLGILGIGLLIYSLKNKEYLEEISNIFLLSSIMIFPFYTLNYGYLNLEFRYDRPSLLQPILLFQGFLIFKVINIYYKNKIFSLKYISVLIILSYLCIFQVTQGFSFLFTDNSSGYVFIKGVAELQPLYKSNPLEILNGIGFLAFLMPIISILILIKSLKEKRISEFIISFNFLALLLVSMSAKRFLAGTTIFLGPLIMIFILELNKNIQKREFKIISTSLIIILTITPISFASYNLTTIRKENDNNIELMNLLKWIKENTKKPINPFNPSENTGYTIMSEWSDGHYITTRGERPCVTDNFGSNADIFSKIILSKNYNESLELIKKHKSKYIIISSKIMLFDKSYFELITKKEINWITIKNFNYKNEEYNVGFPGEDFSDTLFENLYLFDGNGSKELNIKAINNFKLVYKSEKKENINILKNTSGETKYIILGKNYPKEFTLIKSNIPSYKVFEIL